MAAKVICDNPECNKEESADVTLQPPFAYIVPSEWLVYVMPHGVVGAYCSEECLNACQLQLPGEGE